MERISKAVTFTLTLAVLLLGTACTLQDGKGNGGTGGTGACRPGPCSGNVQRVLVLDTSTPNYPASNPCKYQPEHVRCSNCQLDGLGVQANGGSAVPAGIDFRHDSTLDNNRPINLSPPPWSATASRLNCSTAPGCADGRYVVQLDNPNGSDCANFGTVTLTLTLR